ncbi:MAG: 2-hydroxyglutaryl-CoA dehydratase [Chloroflexi bacterium]|nr:2-hydroxyglutaryl-CoA dehydratase [Chloroflexota bacterium]MBM4453230.1 2-hydroxyglutaryl-CoA dehydratase [Chloroflexota bacterium]
MSWFMGIDIGSAYSKGVIAKDSEIAAYTVVPSGANYRQTAEKIRQELLARLKLSADDIVATVATGTGAGNVLFASQKVSDMICTARGINSVFPAARTAIDIAGQSSKVMRIDPQGMVTNFAVSEKCAAGSGRFIEVIANVLRIDLKDFGPLSLLSKSPVAFSTGCAVFGESEAITRVAEGVPKEDIAAGVNKALADKISSLVKKVKLEEPCAICGGGAFNVGLVTMIEQELDINVLVPPQPQIIAALGAALIAQSTNSTL